MFSTMGRGRPLKTLDRLDTSGRERFMDSGSTPVISRLPIVDDDQLDPFKDDLKTIFAASMDLGRAAERDQSASVC